MGEGPRQGLGIWGQGFFFFGMLGDQGGRVESTYII